MVEDKQVFNVPLQRDTVDNLSIHVVSLEGVVVRVDDNHSRSQLRLLGNNLHLSNRTEQWGRADT